MRESGLKVGIFDGSRREDAMKRDRGDNKVNIAIVTPAYNNGHLLYRLFISLKNSKCKEFSWIIIDDGSTDDTSHIMETIKQEADFRVMTITKSNGGKCRALNQVFSVYDGFGFYMVIDSDEMVLPDAIGILREKVDLYADNEDVGAIYFWRDMKNDSYLKKKFLNRPKGDHLLTIFERKAGQDLFGDGAIGYYKRFVSRYRFREFPDENFLGEITILLMAAITGYADHIAYVDILMSEGEYTENGLTAQGRTLRLKNPYGMIFYSGMMQSKLMADWRVRCKYAISAQAYACTSNISKKDLEDKKINPGYLRAWAKLPGWMLGTYWKRKYIYPR